MMRHTNVPLTKGDGCVEWVNGKHEGKAAQSSNGSCKEIEKYLHKPLWAMGSWLGALDINNNLWVRCGVTVVHIKDNDALCGAFKWYHKEFPSDTKNSPNDTL